MNNLLVDRSKKGVTLLTLNRPEKRNALNLHLIESLESAVSEAHQLPDQKVIVINGAGAAFCTGLDLAETMETKSSERIGGALAKLFLTLYSSHLVTIAAIHGFSLAGGAGIAAACDITVAEKNCMIGFPEVRRGLIAALVSTLLQRQISERSMRELLLLGELIDAARAYTIGLVNRVTEEGHLLEEAMSLAEVAMKGAPSAIVETKRLLEELHPIPLRENIELALVFHKQARTHSDAHEGIRAFLEGRKPKWEET